MEKGIHVWTLDRPITGRKTLSRWLGILVACVVCSVVWSGLWKSNCHRLWPLSPVSKSPVAWTKCDDVIECGRLDVPLDYHNLSAGNASLALAKYPATAKTGRLGTLFLNPGGPGGSGVGFIYRIGHNISELVDGRYDIVSWDPRGINETLPRVECFTSQTEQDLFYLHTAQEAGISMYNLTKPNNLAIFTSQIQLEDARNEALVKLCVNRTGEEALKHVGTSTVVRDLELLSRTLEGDAPVNFWRFSYGTIVGSYFVNMFPDRVGRVAIDGVVDPVGWSHIHSVDWGIGDFVSTENVLHGFLETCSKAGPDGCSLARETSSALDLGQRLDKLLADLYTRPLPVPQAKRPGALTAGHLRNFLFTFMYRPRSWPELADRLKAAFAGDGAPILDYIQNNVQLNTSVPAQTSMAGNAVACVDAPGYSEEQKKDALQEKIDAVMAGLDVSPHFGSLGAATDLCHLWPVRETEHFTGPFNSTLANDILIIGNTYDPITPLVNAVTVHSLLPQSTLIQHDGYGHCSLAMISLCTARILREYFLDGTLPDAREVLCPVTEPLFPTSAVRSDVRLWNTLEGDARLSAEDVRLLEVMQGLGDSLDILPRFVR